MTDRTEIGKALIEKIMPGGAKRLEQGLFTITNTKCGF
jgi:hypothetical protein